MWTVEEFLFILFYTLSLIKIDSITASYFQKIAKFQHWTGYTAHIEKNKHYYVELDFYINY